MSTNTRYVARRYAKVCEACHEPFEAKRVDARFCSDRLCQADRAREAKAESQRKMRSQRRKKLFTPPGSDPVAIRAAQLMPLSQRDGGAED